MVCGRIALRETEIWPRQKIRISVKKVGSNWFELVGPMKDKRPQGVVWIFEIQTTPRT